MAMALGLALAVLVMAYIPSTMVSFYDDIIDKAVEQTSAHITVWPREKPKGQMARALQGQYGEGTVLLLDDRTSPRKRDMNGYHAVAARTAQADGVVSVAAFVEGDATVSRGRVNLGITVVGVTPSQYARVVNIAKHFPGRKVPKLGPSDVAIGFRMADKLAVHVGEHIHVATAKTQRLMKVRAIFRSGYYDKDMHTSLVALRTAQRMFAMGNEVSALAVRCRRLDEADVVTEGLRQLLPYKIRNWMDDNASLLAEIDTVKQVTLLINVLVAAVASIGIANVFSMFVLNRQKELAILRAIGASRVSLRTILMLEAAFIWLVGTVLGVTLALGVMAYEQVYPLYNVSAETYGIDFYSTQPSATAFGVACALAAASMAASAWLSGRRAARLNPAEVIFGR
jgi:lipoprotein-releasing system permease protein